MQKSSKHVYEADVSGMVFLVAELRMKPTPAISNARTPRRNISLGHTLTRRLPEKSNP